MSDNRYYVNYTKTPSRFGQSKSLSPVFYPSTFSLNLTNPIASISQ